MKSREEIQHLLDLREAADAGDVEAAIELGKMLLDQTDDRKTDDNKK